MTKAEFIISVEAEPTFIKWATIPDLVETTGMIEKWRGVAYVNTPDGVNLVNVFFLVDTATGNAGWQNQNVLSPVKNTGENKIDKLEKYLKQTFFAYHFTMIDTANYWAEADVYTDGTDLTKSKVLVYKIGAGAVTHKKVI